MKYANKNFRNAGMILSFSAMAIINCWGTQLIQNTVREQMKSGYVAGWNST
jgi:hypothetical protein